MGAEQAMFLADSVAACDPLPIPNGPLAVGLDGAIVRARRGPTSERASNLFEVITGKSILSFRRDEIGRASCRERV